MNASGQIPLIFIGQGVAVIFAVTGDKDLPGILGGDNRRAGCFGQGQKLEGLFFVNIVLVNLGVTSADAADR